MNKYLPSLEQTIHGLVVAAIGGATGAIESLFSSPAQIETCTSNFPACVVAIKSHVIVGVLLALGLYFKTPPKKADSAG
jgi:hypothetical protein